MLTVHGPWVSGGFLDRPLEADVAQDQDGFKATISSSSCLLHHEAWQKELSLFTYLILGSARTVAVVPTLITGNRKSVLHSNRKVCYLLEGVLFFFVLFLMTQTWPCSRERSGSLPRGEHAAGRLCAEECGHAAGGHSARPGLPPALAALQDCCRAAWPAAALTTPLQQQHRCNQLLGPPHVNSEQAVALAIVAVH